MRIPLLFLATALLAAPAAFAQKAITGQGVLNQETFSTFDGSGFAPSPAAGQLDSDAFAVTGLTDGDLDFGGSGTTGDYARGEIIVSSADPSAGNVSSGGVYAFVNQDTGQRALGVQPTGSDFTPGSFVVRYVNQTGNVILDLDVAYTLLFRNNADRANSFNFSFAADCSAGINSTFTDVPTLDFTTPGTAATDPALLVGGEARSTSFNGVDIPDGQTFCLRFTSDDVSGGGSRDEIGVTAIEVVAESVLPVELTSFTAVANGSGAMLDWTTASETNNQGFDVQIDRGAGFESVGFVRGAGTTLETTRYRFPVRGLAAGSHRFRLEQRDLDGAFDFSPVVELTIVPSGHELTASRTPLGSIDVELTVERAQRVRVAVYDVLGRQVALLHDGQTSGTANLSLDGSRLAAGLYFVRAEGESFSATRQIVRVR